MQNVRMRTKRCSAALRPKCNLLCQSVSSFVANASSNLASVKGRCNTSMLIRSVFVWIGWPEPSHDKRSDVVTTRQTKCRHWRCQSPTLSFYLDSSILHLNTHTHTYTLICVIDLVPTVTVTVHVLVSISLLVHIIYDDKPLVYRNRNSRFDVSNE